MDTKGYGRIPKALYDAITFLAQALPKRSVPTFLELLFGAKNKVQEQSARTKCMSNYVLQLCPNRHPLRLDQAQYLFL
jgi:hypothetical protein